MPSSTMHAQSIQCQSHGVSPKFLNPKFLRGAKDKQLNKSIAVKIVMRLQIQRFIVLGYLLVYCVEGDKTKGRVSVHLCMHESAC